MKNSSRRFLYSLMVVVAFATCGTCFSAPVYSDPAPGGEPKVDPQKALVVFMRNCSAGAVYPVPTYDITNDGEIFVGMPRNGEKSAYYCEPGKRLFMVQGKRNSFLDANLEAGRIYYVMLVSVDKVVVTHEMRPIKKDVGKPEFRFGSPEFKKWCADCKWVVPNDAGRKFVKKRHSAIFANKEYLNEWNSMTGEVKLLRCLAPEDGVTE